MSSELNILIDNIRHFRRLLSEGVGDADMEKYINNHEYIYIYYTGDETNKRGYRTIRPYVLGISTAGNRVIRAWQDRGKSVSFANRPTRNDSEEHDYWNGDKGIVPGWRMFDLDKIEKVYPTGKKFNNSDGTVMIPPKYKEGSDANMNSLIAWVTTKTQPDLTPTEVPSTTAEKTTKWDNFSRGNKNNKKITANDVAILRDIASRIYKKSRGSFLVVINNNNEFEIIDIKDKSKVPTSAVVGTLTNLYDTLVNVNKPVKDPFFEKVKKNKKQTQGIEIKESELPTIPFDRKPFFKQ